MDVKNPEHMEEIIRRGSRLQFDNIVGIASKDKDGKLTLELEPAEFVDKEFAGVVPVDSTAIYYDPNIIRMTKNRKDRFTGHVPLKALPQGIHDSFQG